MQIYCMCDYWGLRYLNKLDPPPPKKLVHKEKPSHQSDLTGKVIQMEKPKIKKLLGLKYIFKLALFNRGASLKP